VGETERSGVGQCVCERERESKIAWEGELLLCVEEQLRETERAS